jgi:hypothetical protein
VQPRHILAELPLAVAHPKYTPAKIVENPQSATFRTVNVKAARRKLTMTD